MFLCERFLYLEFAWNFPKNACWDVSRNWFCGSSRDFLKIFSRCSFWILARNSSGIILRHSGWESSNYSWCDSSYNPYCSFSMDRSINTHWDFFHQLLQNSSKDSYKNSTLEILFRLLWKFLLKLVLKYRWNFSSYPWWDPLGSYAEIPQAMLLGFSQHFFFVGILHVILNFWSIFRNTSTNCFWDISRNYLQILRGKLRK